jgi:CBS domain-containing protein
MSRGERSNLFLQTLEEIMSRYRDDRDDRDYGVDWRGGRGGDGEERYDSGYGEQSNLRGARERDYDDPYRGRGRSGGRDYAGEDYDRGRYTGGRSADYRDYESRSGGYYDEGRGRERDDYGRPYYGEGREYVRGRGRASARSRVRCRDIMTRDVTVATRETTLREVAIMMREEDTGIIPVVEREDTPVLTSDQKLEDAPKINNRVRGQGRLVGLITDRDIVVRAIAEGKDVTTTRAEEVMTTDLHTAHPNDRVIDVIRKMGDKQVRRIPIVSEQGSLRGIISMADISLETEEDRELADALEEISSGSSFWSKIFG